jgi:putative restriction endonuclease
LVRELADYLGVAERDNPAPERDIEEWEQRVETQISTDTSISETERDALIRSRRGQGLFRSRVRQVERECRITKVRRAEHLIASHIQPWRRSSNDERLDGENGLLLTPTIDHLFDKGFISFEDTGKLIVSPVADAVSLERMGVDRTRIATVGSFSEGQRRYLDFHQNHVLRQARVRVSSA